MCYLHDKQNEIIHGDLKSPNIIIDKEGNAKITDFGLSCFIKYDGGSEINKNEVSSFNPLWSAPELLNDSKISKKCDVFSFAIILWELLMFKRPYDLSEHDQAGPFRIALQIMEDDLRPEIPNDRKKIPGSWDPIIEKYITLIQHCWQKNPDDRPNFPYIKKKLLLIQNALFPSTLPEQSIKMDDFGDISEIIRQMKSFKAKPFQQTDSDYYSQSTAFKYIKCLLIVICLLFLLFGMFASLMSVVFTSCDHYDNQPKCRKQEDDSSPSTISDSNKTDNYEDDYNHNNGNNAQQDFPDTYEDMDDGNLNYYHDGHDHVDDYDHSDLYEYIASIPLPMPSFEHDQDFKFNEKDADNGEVRFEDIKLAVIACFIIVFAILIFAFAMSYYTNYHRKM